MEFIKISAKPNGYAILTMDSGKQRNALTQQFVEELLEAFALLKQQRPSCVILQGRQDVFCAGGDKSVLQKLAKGEVVTDDLIVADETLNLPFPVIAAMEGHALGGGLALAACCDIVLAAEESRYGAVFMNMGFTPGMGSTTLLPLLMGSYVAAEMMYSGKRFKGKELNGKNCAINYIGLRTTIMPMADDIAGRMADKPVESLYLLKHSLINVKKKLMLEARLQEDLMHRLSFGFPETQKRIEELY